MHQLARQIEVIDLQDYGDQRRRTFRGVESIESKVLPNFRLAPAVLGCW